MIYFGIQIESVFNYNDPLINSYTILEERNDMDTPAKFEDYNMKLFYFFSDADATPVQLDPRIGSLALWSMRGTYDVKTGFLREESLIPTKEIDFVSERDSGLQNYDGLPIKGIMTAQN